ncbi:MAG: universal stress protein [Phycisphaerales bacterium]
MTHRKSIVVGIDYSDGSRAALATATAIAATTGAEVHAVHVIDALAALDLEAALASSGESARERLVTGARTEWHAFSAAVPGGTAALFELRTDNRLAGLYSVAEMREADLLVIGAGAEPGRVGSLAIPCVRHSKRDVLVVRGADAGVRTIVACVDFSTASRDALSHAASLATDLGAALHVLHVFDEPWRSLHAGAAGVDADGSLARGYADATQARMRDFTRDLGATLGGRKATCSVVRGSDIAASIEQYARDVGADLIAIGTRGRTTLRDLLLGSVAERVIRDSTRSIFAVKPSTFRSRLTTDDPNSLAHSRVLA